LIVKSDFKFQERTTMRTLGIMLLLAVVLQGCGRKGPLFLPATPAASQQPAPTQPSTDKTESKK
jgi:predicted small lipoprotein YifL